jgi:hypothetical protein
MAWLNAKPALPILVVFCLAIAGEPSKAAEPSGVFKIIAPAGKVDNAPPGGLLDENADLPELQGFFQSGPNDVRDILVVDDGLLVATGSGILRYRYSGDMPRAVTVYTTQHGLPSDNCYLFGRDADGGIWVHCQGGIAYLPAKSEQWQTFTEKNGLASGIATNLALSPDARRVWVTGTGGLSTALVRDRQWQVFPKRNLVDILVHPTKDIVWCRRLIAARCMCGRHIVTLQFDMRSRNWREVPQSGSCAHAAPIPSYFSISDGVLWMSAVCDPPMLFDLKKNTTRTWPKQPNWERLKNGKEVTYWDWFGAMVPAPDDKGVMWFATNAGLWYYDFRKDCWHGHIRNPNPGCDQALLARGIDGRTLYWECGGNIAAYDVRTDKWTDLWHVDIDTITESKHHLTLSPDGKTLWLLGAGVVFVGDLATGKTVTLGDKERPGLTKAKFVRFDPKRGLALLGTWQGAVCSDIDGKLRFTLVRQAPPLLHEVSKFAFAPDGSEVWCLMKDEGGLEMSAAVLHPKENRWEMVPDGDVPGSFSGVAFSRNRPIVVLPERRGEDGRGCGAFQRGQHALGWESLDGSIPRNFRNVNRLWTTPNGDELWLGGVGLLRVKLASRETTFYGSQSFEEDHAIIANIICDVAFSSDGKFAACLTYGVDKQGLSLIDLASGKAVNYVMKEQCYGAELVFAPDNRTVWYSSGRFLYAFNVEMHSWTHKLCPEEGMPLENFRAFRCSPDSSFVWLRGYHGAAVYRLADRSWKALADGDWIADEDENNTPPLVITPDGKHVLCGHRRGVAIIKIDGTDFEVLSPGGHATDCCVSHIVPIPGTEGYVCSILHPDAEGLYHIDLAHRTLRKIKDLKGSTVTAMAIGPNGFLWVARPGNVLCVNPSTGADRPGLNALRVGEPTTEAISASTTLGNGGRDCSRPGAEMQDRVPP